jgi:hypothetical protein
MEDNVNFDNEVLAYLSVRKVRLSYTGFNLPNAIGLTNREP